MKKYLPIFITILLSIIRLVSKSEYVNICVGLIISYLSIFGISFLIKHYTKKKIFEVLPISIITMILVLIVFGLVDLLFIGTIILLLASLISFNYYWIKDNYNYKIFFSKGLIFFNIMAIGLFVADYFACFNISDEYTYWSIASKNMYYSNSFNFSEMNFLSQKIGNSWYPPNPTVLYYYIMKIMGSYRQGFELFIHQMFGFSLLLPLFKFSKNKLNSLLISSICVFIPAIFVDSYFYITIYVDTLLGLLTGYAIFEYLTSDDKKYNNLIFMLVISLLCFTKSSGFMFAFILIEFYAISKLLQLFIINKEKLKNVVISFLKDKYIYIFTIIFFLSMFIWKFYCSNHPAINNYQPLIENNHQVRTISDTISSVIGAMTGYNYDSYSESFKNFFVNILDKKYYSIVPFEMSASTWIALFIILLIGISFLIKKDKDKKELVISSVTLITCIISYMLLLQLSYMVMFNASEAINHASAQRYVGSILVASLFVIIGLAFKYKQNYDNRYVLIIFSLVLLFTPITPIAEGTITSGARNYRYRSYEKNEMALSKIILENIKDKKAHIGSINQKPNNFFIKTAYWSVPVKMYDSVIITDDVLNKVDFFNHLESYDYFITIELDDFMIDLIKENYNIELEEWSLYKIENKIIEKIDSIDM